jgi:hypothetical protein
MTDMVRAPVVSVDMTVMMGIQTSILMQKRCVMALMIIVITRSMNALDVIKYVAKIAAVSVE